MQSKIGLAVIVKDEQALIRRFISENEVTQTFSEVKILDGFSSDGTWEILQEYKNDNFKIYQRDLNFDFSAQRNHLSSLMTSEYILRLDVDEFLCAKLKKLILKGTISKDYYKVLRFEFVDGKQLNITPTPLIYRNTPTIYWQNKIHECIVGYQSQVLLPATCTIKHDKTSARCEKQNRFYYSNWEEQRRIVNGGKK